MLEEGSFRRRTADFVMMFIFGGICMIVSLTNNNYHNQSEINVAIESEIVFLRASLFLNYIVDFCIFRQFAILGARIHDNVGVCVVTTKSFCQDELFWTLKLPSTFCLKSYIIQIIIKYYFLLSYCYCRLGYIKILIISSTSSNKQ